MRKGIVSICALLLIGFLAGCASSTARETDALLAQDYLQLNDQELLRYYFQVTDQIARVERQGTGTGVGFGIGTGIGGSTGVGVGVGRGVTRGTIADDLRERRNDVRLELSRRGIQP